MVLTYFDPNAQHEVNISGCPLGVSAMLVQRSPNEDNWWVLQYASRDLADVEWSYSQSERQISHVENSMSFSTANRSWWSQITSPLKPFSTTLGTEMFVQMLDYEFGVKDRPGTTNITQWQSRPRTSLCLEESYGGNYPKGYFPRRKFRVTRSVSGTR